MVGRVRPGFVAEDLGEAGEVGVGLALVHVLFAFEDYDVVVAHDLERDEDSLVVFGEVAEDEFDVDLCAGRALRAVDHAQEVALVVMVRESEDADEDPDVGFFGGGSAVGVVFAWQKGAVVGPEGAFAESRDGVEADLVDGGQGAEAADEEDGGEDETRAVNCFHCGFHCFDHCIWRAGIICLLLRVNVGSNFQVEGVYYV